MEMATQALRLLAASVILPAVVLASNTTAPNLNDSKIYFRFQSRDISFEKWISMFTLCLAPLITHIAFGFAEPVILSSRQPKWTDRIVQFNPITIVWRWFAIAYRRIQARNWDKADMAASNAIFWTGERWDGSETMMLRSREWITKLPKKTHVELVSASSAATIGMTFQGVDTVFRLVKLARYGSWHNTPFPLPSVFFPIAGLSLLRLPAAIWLSEDYTYEPPTTAREEEEGAPLSTDYSTNLIPLQPSQSSAPSKSLSSQFQIRTVEDSTSRLLPSNTFKSRLWLAIWLFCVISVNGFGIFLSASNNGPRPGIIITQSSSFVFSVLYFVLSASALMIVVFYLLRGHATSTMLPCMNSRWYKALTVLLGVLAVVAVVFAALETKIRPDGEYETYSVP